MGLNIDSSIRPIAEIQNHPSDIHIIFNGGYFVWNYEDPPLGIWWESEMFVLSNNRYQSPISARNAFNQWSQRTTKPWTVEEILQREG